MTIKLNQPILNLEDEPIKQNGKEMTVGFVIRNALLQLRENEKPEAKLNKYDLALRCASDEADLQSEDISLIKKCVGETYAPLIVGRVRDAVDPVKK